MARPRSTSSGRPLAPRVPAGLEPMLLDEPTLDGWSESSVSGTWPEHVDGRLLLTACRLERASLVGARLAGSRLVDVIIDGADLAGVRWDETSMTRVEIRDSRLSGAQLAQARLRDVRFVGCHLDEVNLRMAHGERVRFERCRMRRAELIGARFVDVAWWDCDLTDAEVSRIELTNAQLHGSTIDGLRGAHSLAPITIDEAQFPVLAAHLLAAAGVTVEDRRD